MSSLLRPSRPVGFIGYGAYVPRYRLPAREVARVWTGGKSAGLPIKEKAVPPRGIRLMSVGRHSLPE